MKAESHRKKARPAERVAISLFPLMVFVFASPFAIGLFHPFLSALATVFLLAFLLYVVRKRGRLNYSLSPMFLACAALSLGYGFTCLYAVDKGMAPLGFVQFLPVLCFALLLLQLYEDERRRLLNLVPLSGVCMTALSLPLSFIPALSPLFTVNSRLSGFFQYPNAFAAFLLVGLLLLLCFEPPLKIKFLRSPWFRLLASAILIAGILFSGSRTVFLLLLLCLPFALFAIKTKRTRLIVLLLAAGVAIAGAGLVLLLGKTESVGRFLTTSLSESTFLGRLLYYRDAVGVILKHPFGLGYMGYYYMQGSFQSGVYSVAFVHNELLQLLLDVGWIPAALTASAIVKAAFIKKGSWALRLPLIALCAHCMLDFDLQFCAIFFVLLLLLDVGKLRSLELGPQRYLALLPLALTLPLCLYLGLANAAWFFHDRDLTLGLYPNYTSAELELLTSQTDTSALNETANHILSHNDHVSLAYSAKALCAYEQGDFELFIRYKERAIALARYTASEYQDYADKLIIGIGLYEQANSESSARYCAKRLLALPDLIQETLDSSSSLAFLIDDKPELALSLQTLELIELYRGRYGT